MFYVTELLNLTKQTHLGDGQNGQMLFKPFGAEVAELQENPVLCFLTHWPQEDVAIVLKIWFSNSSHA